MQKLGFALLIFYLRLVFSIDVGIWVLNKLFSAFEPIFNSDLDRTTILWGIILSTEGERGIFYLAITFLEGYTYNMGLNLTCIFFIIV